MATKALVVDDSRAMRGVLAKILGTLGFTALQAGNGIEALVIMHAEGAAVELILVDWNMPEMNGLEFVKALRGEAGFQTVPIIMVTSETDIDHMLDALSAGANEYMMKPFTAEMVEEKLRILQIFPEPVSPVQVSPVQVSPVQVSPDSKSPVPAN